MVRLRSDRWFAAHGQKRSRSMVQTRVSGTRRLISLCFLLALVILMMQKAADPRNVRNAFQAIGVPLDQSNEIDAQGNMVGQGTEVQMAESELAGPPYSLWIATCEDLFPTLLDSYSDNRMEQLASAWFSKVSESADQREALELLQLAMQDLDTIDSKLSTELGSTDAEGSNPWQDQLDAFGKQWTLLIHFVQSRAEAEDRGTGTLDVDFVRLLDEYLDRRLLASTVDATVWRSAENIAFWRLLTPGRRVATGTTVTNADSAEKGLSTSVSATRAGLLATPRVSTLQLEALAKTFKGRQVRFRGSVRRVDRFSKPNVLTGEPNTYWMLWLRGLDNANQPVVVYTTDSTTEQLELAQHSSERETEVEIRGIVGKRLAYSAQKGLEVAPTLFAREQRVLQLAESVPVKTESGMLKEFLYAAIAGCILGALIVIPMVTNLRRKRSRKTISTRIRHSSVAKFILLAASAVSSSAVADDDSASPPWAKLREERESNRAVRQLVGERLREILQPGSVERIQGFIKGERDFPDAIAKSIRFIAQVGWDRMLTIDTLNLSGSVSLERIRLAGIVVGAQRVNLTADQQKWFPLKEDSLRIVQLEIQQGQDTAINRVYCTNVPTQWLSTSPLRQPSVLEAIKVSEMVPGNEATDSYVLLGDSPVWVLDGRNGVALAADQRRPQLSEHWIWLGEKGWDLAALDLLARGSQKPILNAEATAFYSMMKIATSDSTGFPRPDSLTDPRDVLAAPSENAGKPVRWRVRLVNGSVIEVAESESKTLGADRYFQLDGFVDIGRGPIVYEVPSDVSVSGGREKVVFEGEFPITVVTSNERFVPAEALSRGEFSWEIGEYAELDGLFYRVWAYRSELLQAKHSSARQAAPLVVAVDLAAATPIPKSRESPIGWFGVALCAGTLCFLGAILFFSLRTEPRRRFR